MCERERGEVVQSVALGRLGPIKDVGPLVIFDEDMGDLKVAVHEHLWPWTEHGLGEPAIARDHVDGQDIVGDEPVALVGESGRELVEAGAGPGAPRALRRHQPHVPRPELERFSRDGLPAVDQPGASIEREHQRLVGREQRIDVAVRKPVSVLGSGSNRTRSGTPIARTMRSG